MTKRMTWDARIARAEKASVGFTDVDIQMAGDWPTCAVGEYKDEYETMLDDTIPRESSLVGLGHGLFNAVFNNKIHLARDFYNQIQSYFATVPLS